MAFNSLTKRAEKLATSLKRVSLSVRPADVNINLQSFVEKLKIIDKKGDLVSLIMNKSQEMVFEKIIHARDKQVPARFICLKARQLGISTLIAGIIFALITLFSRRFGLVAAHSLSGARSIFAMTQRFYAHTDEQNKPLIAKNNARKLEYAAPHYSSLQVDTAANPTLARGSTFHYVHASEVAFWDHAEESALAINQATPQHWDTMVFWESTANGINNLFHRMWIAAERGETATEPIFLSWKDFPTYSLPPAQPLVKTRLTTREKEYASIADLGPEQLNWAIQTRKNQCQDSWDKFHQEYPALASLAFAFTATPWFNQSVIQEWIKLTRESAPLTGRVEWPQSRDEAGPFFIQDDYGPVLIWSQPQRGATYSLGMDVGEGIGADYTVIHVLKNESGELCATYRSNRVRPEQAGAAAYSLAAFYNYGLLGVERNGPGLATLVACERGLADYPWMTGYPNLYYQTRLDKKLPDETERLGWLTSRATKEAMLSRLGEAIDHRDITITDPVTLLELQGLVWDTDHRCFRQNYRAPGAKITHDDCVMALAIANEMRRNTDSKRFLCTRLSAAGDL
ncbi:MAG: hypothetical protein ACP5VS_08075 [Desulfomonilaceae bacterium]